MKFYIVFLFGSIFTTIAAVSVGECKQDIEKIGSWLPPLNNALDALPQHHTISDGLNIEHDFLGLRDALNKAADELKTMHLSASDSQTLFKAADTWFPQVLRLLNNAVNHKADINMLNYPGIDALVEIALKDLHKAHDSFCNNLADASTVDVKDQIKARKVTDGVAFDNAEKVFST
ncbi:hypothetical protein H0H93_004589 [Arthromyces matolae]|nr:hypothetical protein H0H93_004589 [Arthromyces matolae]